MTTAADVTAALTAAAELAEVWLIDHTDEPLPDRARLYATLTSLLGASGRLAVVTDHLRDELHPELRAQDAPLIDLDGHLWRAGHRKSRKAFDKTALRGKVSSVALAPVTEIDEATGEILGQRPPTAAEAVDVVWRAADVATGRSKVLRDEFGLDLDEYAETAFTPVLVEVNESDVHPDELARLRPDPNTP